MAQFHQSRHSQSCSVNFETLKWSGQVKPEHFVVKVTFDNSDITKAESICEKKLCSVR